MVDEARENPQAETPSSAEEVEAVATQASEPADSAVCECCESAVDEALAEARAQLAEAEQKAAEYLDGWQRSQAAFANYRKRSEAEQMNWRAMANAALLSRMLPVVDDFRRAFDVLPAELEGHAWLNGIALIRRKLQAILDSENAKPIAVKPGDPFDPLYHQAVLYQVVEGFGEGQIVTEIEAGYLLGERVLRPAQVVVAKAPTPVPSSVGNADEGVYDPEAAEPKENADAG